MRIGIFGGTFDPVHFGHLLLAETAREEGRLDEVWFVPAAVAPHKQHEASTPGERRAEMLELAIADNEALRVCRIELDRGGVSFTVDTLAQIAAEQPGADLFLLLGADSLEDLPSWHRPEEICRLATPVVARRPGAAEPDFSVLSAVVSPQRLEEIRACQVSMPLIDLASSEIRRRAAAGRSIRYQTPDAVVKYIESQRLYRPKSSRSA
jgi:nicotinate-nucleotide adenylyltransferase